jgi:hypothetical protein
MQVIIFPLGFPRIPSYIGGRDGAYHSKECVRLTVADPRLLGRLRTVVA